MAVTPEDKTGSRLSFVTADEVRTGKPAREIEGEKCEPPTNLAAAQNCCLICSRRQKSDKSAGIFMAVG
jgi:hypothetical protein